MTEPNTTPTTASVPAAQTPSAPTPAVQTSSATTATEGETQTTAQTTAQTTPAWLIPGHVYDILKWLALILLPAVAVFINTVGPAWGWPHIQSIVVTVNAVALLIGAGIGVSTIKGLLTLAA